MRVINMKDTQEQVGVDSAEKQLLTTKYFTAIVKHELSKCHWQIRSNKTEAQ